MVESSPAVREAWVHFPAHAPTVSPWGFPCSSVGKRSACNAGNLGSISGSGRFPRERNGYPFQFSCLENPMDRGACRPQSMGSQELDRLGDLTRYFTTFLSLLLLLLFCH